MERANKPKPLSAQIRKHSKKVPKKKKLDGNTETMISTGSTLLDLAICGTRVRGGGIPGGILMEIFGPSSSGKTVLLFEIGGFIQRQGGEVHFDDPEARLDPKFAKRFDFDLSTVKIDEPNTVTEVMQHAYNYNPDNKARLNGLMVDSLAALSTDMEMNNEDGDKMGMRRAKELSEGLRKICRIIKQRNHLMVCSNQIRVNAGAAKFGEQFTVPGGKAVEFYSSVRLRFMKATEVKKEISFHGKKIKGTIGTKVNIKVYKNSVDEGYRDADIYIMKGYGIDNIRANLVFLKSLSNTKVYFVNEITLDKSLDKSVIMVEKDKLEDELEETVIDLWEALQDKFIQKRIKKRR